VDANTQHPAHFSAFTRTVEFLLDASISIAERERRAQGRECDDCRLWLELLRQTLRRSVDNASPEISRSDLSTPVGVVLTGRRWLRFVKRWQAHISPNLKQACIGCNASLLYPGRRSNKRGGRAEVSEAGYFLSLTPPASTRSSGSFTLVAPKETSYPQPSEPRDLESSFKFLEAVKEIKELHAQAALLNLEIEIKLKKLSDLMLCKYP
jgi:hypothetical protein